MILWVSLLLVPLVSLAQAEELTITGLVLGPDEQPVAGAQVLVQYRTPGRKWVTVTQKAETDVGGGFSFTCDSAHWESSVQVAARKPGLAVDWAAVEGGQRLTLRLGATPATLSGVVRDAEGNPIVGAEAYISLLLRLPGDKRVMPFASSGTSMPGHLTAYFSPQDHAFISAVTNDAGRGMCNKTAGKTSF